MTKGWFAQPDHHAIPALCQQLLALSQQQFDSIRGAISVGIDQSRKTVKSLSIPALVLHGQADQNRSTAEARALSSRVGGQFVLFEHSGHMTMIEQTDLLAETISTWVTTL